MQWAILIAAALLLLGFVLRAKLRVLQVFFVPASVAGGLVGLVAFQVALHWPKIDDTLIFEPAATALTETLRGWPGPLIAVVFAGLLLERKDESIRNALRGAALAGIMVWIIVVGQVVLGLVASALVIEPMFDVPAAFGQLIEAGFAGGHGTAAAMGGIFEEALDFPAGRDLAFFVATFGLVYSVVSGIVLVNIGVRRRWTQRSDATVERLTGLEDRATPRPIAFGRVRADVIDPLAFQLLLLAAAFGIGALLQWGFVSIVETLPSSDAQEYLTRVPLFLFTLLGGLAVRWIMTLLRVDDLIDNESIKRIVAVAMEFLIVAAIASLRLDAVAEYLWPLVLLLTLGCAWTAVCLLVLSRRILPPDHWFELGVLNYGMSTGTTAQGLMLLRIVDKDFETGAAEHYALAAPLSAPFIGGGVITLSLPLILLETGTWATVAVLTMLLVALYAIGRALNRRGVEP